MSYGGMQWFRFNMCDSLFLMTGLIPDHRVLPLILPNKASLDDIENNISTVFARGLLH